MSKEIQTIKDAEHFSTVSELYKSVPPEEFMKVNCKFCCSNYRHEAESEYSRTTNIASTLKFLRDKGEAISYGAVSNHLHYHYRRKDLDNRVKEYSEEMDKWQGVRPSKEERLQQYIDMLHREINILSALADTTSGRDKTKAAETVAKLIDQVNKCQAEIDKNKEQTDHIKNFIQRFTSIVQLQIQKNSSREVSQELAGALMAILDDASSIVGGLIQ